MSLSPRQKWMIAASITLFVILACFVVLIFYLPAYIENRLLPRWAGQAGVDLESFQIRRIGWRGTDVGPIRLQVGGRPFLSIDAVQIDYSPLALIKRQISGIVLSGVQIDLALNDSATAIVGWPARPAQPSNPKPFSLAEFEQRLSMGVGYLRISHAIIRVHWRGRTFEFPAALEMHTPSPGIGMRHVEALSSVRGNHFLTILDLDVPANAIQLNLTAKALDPASINDLLAMSGVVGAAGRLDLNATVRTRLAPLAIERFSLQALLSDLRIGVSGLTLQNAADATPLAIQMSMADQDLWQFSAAPFVLDGPVRVSVPHLAGRFETVAHGWQSTAELRTELPAQVLNPDGSDPLRLAQPLVIAWRAEARMDAESGVQFELNAPVQEKTTPPSLQVELAERLSMDTMPEARVTGRLTQGRFTSQFRLVLKNWRAHAPWGQGRCPHFVLTGDAASGPGGLEVSTRVEFPDTTLALDQGTIKLPRNHFEARIQKAPDTPWTMTGTLSAGEGLLDDKAHELVISGLCLRLPVQWPLPDKAPAGELVAANILWKSNNFGSLEGKIALEDKGLAARLAHRSKLLDGLIVLIEADAGTKGATIQMEMPPYATASPFDLGRLFPGAWGYTLDGRLQARAHLEMSGGITRSGARLNFEQGAIRHAANQLVVEGVACDLRVLDILNLRSAPRQRLTVEAMTMGNLNAQSLGVDFQLESGPVLFVERTELQWCRGRVQAQAMRFTPGLDELEATLYCDRLNLAMVLGQLGTAQGSGDGEVNGRIPIRWQNGRLRFENGFLYSTPGQTGTIRLQGTEALLEGLPPESPQRIQLDIATEALRDYNYDWAKLKINSEDDLLLLRLQLDGKPNRLLPFAYDTQSGTFIRYQGTGEAEFKGIGIDLNFRVPLEEILHYRDLVAPGKK